MACGTSAGKKMALLCILLKSASLTSPMARMRRVSVLWILCRFFSTIVLMIVAGIRHRKRQGGGYRGKRPCLNTVKGGFEE